MLVGRVDDDTGQAHDPATYVPVLFVDNPWSKALGREVQGLTRGQTETGRRVPPARVPVDARR